MHTAPWPLLIGNSSRLGPLAWVIVLLATTGHVAKAAPVYPKIRYAESMPVIKAAAEKAGIIGGHVADPVDRAGLLPGDSIAVLVSLTKGEDFYQWLVSMTCVELTEAEKQKPPARPQPLYTSLGTEVNFKEDRAAMMVRVLGPYKRVADFHDPAQLRASVKGEQDVTTRILVNADFLRLGFDRACESVLVVRDALKSQPSMKQFNWNVGSKPFPPEVVSQARATADLLGLTTERERAFVGAVPALREFWRLASRTRGLQDIVKDVADLPWWSIIRKGGEVKSKLKPLFSDSQRISLDGLRGGKETGYLFPFGLEINESPALSCTVMAVDPRPPLLPSAGIVGIAAQAPDGNGPYLMVQVWSAHLAGDTK
jgi:hypothetical protein